MHVSIPLKSGQSVIKGLKMKKYGISYVSIPLKSGQSVIEAATLQGDGTVSSQSP